MPDGRRSMHDILVELDVRQALTITVGHQAIMDRTSCMSVVLPFHPGAAGTMTRKHFSSVFFVFFFLQVLLGDTLAPVLKI